ncbi:MAG: XdhC family protein [Candidatus Bathyarchaeota archaeon]|nr:XdhC family protein [Candidatus Bathyarchaeota archaeon]
MSEVVMSVFQKIEELRQKNIPAALVTVIKTSGSVPREVGAKMIVQFDGQIHGTIGGSSVEALVIKEAQDAIKAGRPQTVTHTLSDEAHTDTGMVCGGTMDFFIEPIQIPERVYIFGGGHVGFQVASLTKKVGFDYVVVDDRAEFASTERFPDASNLIVADPGTVAENLTVTTNDYIIIVTPAHKDDYNVLKGVIQKPARYIGMIGSSTKRKQIYQKLRTTDGIPDDLLNKIHSPIGINIGSETPEEIAVSIVAELIQVRRSPT